LKDYFLRELNQSDASRVEAHVKSCADCHEELERLQLMEAALGSLREEEIPQRIAFVSDQVFEPSRWRRWWGAFWSSSARLGFAAAAMVSGAIMFSAYTRPVPAPVVNVVSPKASQVSAQTFSGAEIDRRIREVAAVEAVRAVERADSGRVTEIHELRDELNKARYSLAMAKAEYDRDTRRQEVARVAASGYSFPKSDAAGESK
jgi:anti-sigma factor RsiW